MDQQQYEEQTRLAIREKADTAGQAGDRIVKAVGQQPPLPISVKDYLKVLSDVVGECQQVVEHHSEGDRFSDETLKSVASALHEVNNGLGALILAAAKGLVRP